MRELEVLRDALAGRYQVDREIGRGGMAIVYRATDVRHGRAVAVKVLNPALAGIIGAERFLSEIRVAATLQHPNLLPLFDSGEVDGTLYYVMPFVEGESLRARLSRERQLPLDESLRITTAVASALDYAHRHGVVHRDLKPENILLQDGEPMVADFGIALAISNADGTRLTQTGLSLGTPQYMAPEQATGERHVDGRVDVYALGAILYEMLAGEPPITGATAQAVIARLLTETPRPVRAARPAVPEHVDDAITRALAKIPADRWSGVREFTAALIPGRQQTGVAPVSPFSRRRVAVAAGAGLVVLALVAALAARRGTDRSFDRSFAFTVRLPDTATVATGAGSNGTDITISRDGRIIAYVAGIASGGEASRGIWTRDLNALDARPLRGLERGATPRFSPDGSMLLYSEGGALFAVPVAGGHATRLGSSASSSDWIDTRSVLFTRFSPYWPSLRSGAELWVTSLDNPSPRLVVPRDTARRILDVGFPNVLPGGRYALVTIRKGEPNNTQRELAVASLRDGSIRELGVSGSNARYALGHILFVKSDGALYAAPFSLTQRVITGDPVQVAPQVVVNVSGGADFDVSTDGTIVYVGGSEARRRLFLVDRAGRGVPLTSEVRRFFTPRVSSDGALIAAEVRTPEGFNLWVYDRTSRTLGAVTDDHRSIRPSGWLDGRRTLAFVHVDDSTSEWDISTQQINGVTPRETFVSTKPGPTDATIGGAVIAFRSRNNEIDIAPLQHPDQRRVLVTPGEGGYMPRLSRDDVLAYVSSVGGIAEVYVRPTAAGQARVQISSGGGMEPVWSSTGDELFYRAGPYMVSARMARNPLRVLGRDTLFRDVYMRGDVSSNYDVLPDGKQFVMIQNENPDIYPTVLLNHLRRR